MTSVGMTRAGMARGARAPRNPAASLVLAGVTLLLAVGGCGHEAYEDSYPATSGVIVDGGAAAGGSPAPEIVTSEAVTSETVASESIASDTATPQSTGAILFVASPTGGTPRLIARTDSITTAPTAEFLAHRARGAPVASTRVVAPLVITGDEDQGTPVILPTVPAGTTQASARITISRQTGVDDGPTILKIIEAP